MKLTLPITMLCALVTSVLATPIHIPRDTVTWDVSNPPTDITNPIGSIKLRKDGITFLTLASGFDILLGEYTVPYVAESSEYILVLMGDSGNWSPEFTIRGGPPQCPV
ncbi:hypothetical protein EV421DRAFT_1738661 [Armillaria borealis]|uniref:Uncharacterized protein n=1 Tax=Armillaria borealis TaxID=47425 RepID=A0AA39ML86_9AGAR|nr:hypothetical protein EV421DRAFT_1738661 [Armillaria borealis]